MRAFVLGILIALAGCAPAADEPAVQAASVDPAPAGAAVPAATTEPATSPASTQPAESTALTEPAAPPASTTPPATAASAAAPEAAQRAPKELLTQDGVNYACSVPADCAVKDIGNCCGYYPACVNKDSPTFPEKVKAQCADSGMSSVCGYQDIAACDCIEGRCTALPGSGGAAIDVRKD
jgi:hypothetical protein